MKSNYTIASVTHYRTLNALVLFRLFIILSFIIIICMSFMGVTSAQSKLIIPKKGELKIDKDTLVLDELIIGDSAKIILTKASSLIKARSMVFGTRVRIMGLGEKGVNGRNGRTAAQPDGVCKTGRNGEDGKPGTPGATGKDLILDVYQLTIESMLIVNLAGGNGGDGGTGGEGSQGSNSVSSCLCDGGNGGNGGNGGTGGAGGNLTIINSLTIIEVMSKISLYNRGGYRGVGGEGGSPGLKGIGASKESKVGRQGKVGVDGNPGVDGKLIFNPQASPIGSVSMQAGSK